MGMQLSSVRKQYPGNPQATIEDFSLDVKPGEFIVLLGPSGCGKSTVLRMIAGLIPATSGKIVIEGKDVTEMEPMQRDVSMVFQNYALFPHLTVRENIAFGMKIRKAPKDEIERGVREAAQILQIEDLLDRTPKQISGGQRQRVALGRAIVRYPKVFLFDEPLSNLDAKLRGQMRAEIIQFHQKLQRISVYVTHDQLEAMTMADRIVILNQGLIQQIGEPLEIYNRPRNIFVAGFLGTVPMNLLVGKLATEARKTFFVSEDGIRIGLPEGVLKRYRLSEFGKVTLGIRPEDVYRHESMGQDVQPSEPIASEVKLVESLGDSGIFHCSFKGHSIRVRFRHQLLLSREKMLNLSFDMNKIHLFGEDGVSLLQSDVREGN